MNECMSVVMETPLISIVHLNFEVVSCEIHFYHFVVILIIY